MLETSSYGVRQRKVMASIEQGVYRGELALLVHIVGGLDLDLQWRLLRKMGCDGNGKVK